MKGKQVTNAISEAEQALFDEKLLEASGVVSVRQPNYPSDEELAESGVCCSREEAENESVNSLPALPPGCSWKPIYILIDKR